MATYKVPQNVEAEDKILGPLTLKQFIYAIIGVAWGITSFAIFRSVPILFVIIGLPPTIFLLALGLYQREEQPFEVFFVAVLQFLFRARGRTWVKEPIAEVFRVEPPKATKTDARRNPREVRGQLEKLGEIVDARGWTTKDSAVQEPDGEGIVDLNGRIGAARVEVPPVGKIAETTQVSPADDVLDPNSQRAAQLASLIQNTEQTLQAQAKYNMQHAQQQKPAQPVPVAAAGIPGNSQNANAIMELATEGGDLSVAQIARRAAALLGENPESHKVS